MNQVLWNNKLEFDLDNPENDYGFSIALAKENYWTIEFTEKAILEYKKFMYLASNYEIQISPSAIVNLVWIQHINYVTSYQSFCDVLNKEIQHPSSSNAEANFEINRETKEITRSFYEVDFGKQPKDIWIFNGMYESLNLMKAKIKLWTFIKYGLLAFTISSVPAYFLLKPIYLKINLSSFYVGFIILIAFTLVFLIIYNKIKLKKIVIGFDESSFVFSLKPFELSYLKTQEISSVINGVLNELIENGAVKILENNIIKLNKNFTLTNKDHRRATSALAEIGPKDYPNLLIKLTEKPIFSNTSNSLDSFRKHIITSKKFRAIFYINFILISILLLLCTTRLIVNLSEGQSVISNIIGTAVLAFLSAAFLYQLTIQIATTTIPKLYRTQILPSRKIDNNWQWSYFLFDKAVLGSSFYQLLNTIENSKRRRYPFFSSDNDYERNVDNDNDDDDSDGDW